MINVLPPPSPHKMQWLVKGQAALDSPPLTAHCMRHLLPFVPTNIPPSLPHAYGDAQFVLHMLSQRPPYPQHPASWVDSPPPGPTYEPSSAMPPTTGPRALRRRLPSKPAAPIPSALRLAKRLPVLPSASSCAAQRNGGITTPAA
jgi:hypothetical protein